MRKEELLKKIQSKPLPKHIALILDGNGRWAKKRGLPRTMGHHKGAKTLQEIATVANQLGISYLTCFVFSTENWSRPQEEVDYIMKEVIRLCENWPKTKEKNIKLQMIGSRKQVSSAVLSAIDEAVKQTKNCTGLTLSFAFNYGGKEEIIQATKSIAKLVQEKKLPVDAINESVFEGHLYTHNMPMVDLMVRTSGEMRISNFLLWQIAYAEMYFPRTYWPDFHEKEFYIAIEEYQSRHRRFGGLEDKSC